MDVSKNGIIELASYEAVSTKKYLDTSEVQTVGIGSTASDISDLHSWSWDKEITLTEAFDYFTKTLQPYVDAVNSSLEHPVSQQQFDALVSITYNIGINGEAHSSFLRSINEYGDSNTIDGAIRAWNRSGGVVSRGLENRREKEINLFENGVYSNNGTILYFPVDNNHHPMYHLGKNIDASQYL